MIFDVDFERQTLLQLPVDRREFNGEVCEVRLAFLRGLRKPVEELYASNMVIRDNLLKQVSFNNQTILFEAALNDRFDPVNKGIYIDNTFDNKDKTYLFYRLEKERKTYVYYRSEEKPKTIIYYRSEFGENFDFIINVPFSIGANLDELGALANLYNHAGMTYLIQIY